MRTRLLVAIGLLLPLCAGPVAGQIRDLLEELLGGGGGRIESVEAVAESSGTVTLRVGYEELEETAGVALTARVLDVRLRHLVGFTAEPVAVEGSAGTADVVLGYTGAEPVVSASVELRLEHDGALLARTLHPLVRSWGGGNGDGAESTADPLTPHGEEPSGPSPAAHEPEEILIEPVPLGDTPTAAESLEEVEGGGEDTVADGDGTSGGTGGLGTVIRDRSILHHGVIFHLQPSLGYLWAQEPSGGSYSPSAAYAYNSAGGEITVARGGTGRYGIQLRGLGSGAAKAGGLLVTAYGNDSSRCQVSSWDTHAAGFQGAVHCVTGAGTPADARFTSLAVLSLGNSRVGYALADRPTTASYTPTERYASSPGGAVGVTRGGIGTYSVGFPGLLAGSADRGHVQVTSRGTGGEYCKVATWNPGSGGLLTAEVRCFSATGIPADSHFSVLALSAAQNAGHLGYTFANQPAAESYAPLPQLTSSPAGTTITRSGRGAYAVRFAGLGGSRGGTVQVTAAGAGAEWCKVLGWGAGGDQLSANVRCYDAGGQAADSLFSTLVVR
jgi:hypothetical protein